MSIKILEPASLSSRSSTQGLRRRQIETPRTRAELGGRADVSEKPDDRVTSRIPVLLLFVSLAIPWVLYFGPLRMAPYRILLTVMVLPCIGAWMTGAAGRIRLADVAVLLFAAWSAISVSAVHGVGYAIQPSGIFFIETAGAYFLGRCFIRNAADFHYMAKCYFWTIFAILPFAMYKSLTGFNISRAAFAVVWTSHPDWYMEPRWGLRRSQNVFEHPILFGVFASGCFALTYQVLGYGRRLFARLSRAGIVALAAFWSLSSGPLTALAVQMLLIGWDNVLKSFSARWMLLGALLLAMYFVVAIGSNQSVVEFYIHYFAFSEATGWDRILIWQYGWQSILNYPAFGIGFNEYERAEWMEPSIDMFWLLNTVRYGMPGGFFMLLIFAASVVPVIFQKTKSEKIRAYKLGYLIAMASFFLVGWTVHFWNATYVLFLFLIGSGAWIRDVPTNKVAEARATYKPRNGAIRRLAPRN